MATESALSGRYAPFSADIRQIWFSGDDTRAYTLYGAEVEQGTYSYRGDTGKLVLTSASGAARELHVDISKHLSEVVSNGVSTESLNPRAGGPTGGAASTADDPNAPSLAPTCDDGAADPGTDKGALIEKRCPTTLVGSDLELIAAQLIAASGDKGLESKVAKRTSGSPMKASASSCAQPTVIKCIEATAACTGFLASLVGCPETVVTCLVAAGAGAYCVNTAADCVACKNG